MSEPTADHPEPTLVPTPTASEPAPDATPAAAPVFAAPQPAEPPVFAPKPAARPPPPAARIRTPSPPSHAGRSALPVLTAVGFIFVLLAVAWVWNTELNLYKQLAGHVAATAAGRRACARGGPRSEDGDTRRADEEPGAAAHRAGAPPRPNARGCATARPVAGRRQRRGARRPACGLETRLKTAEQRQSKLAEQTALAQRVQQALSALDAGEPLGDLPGAPPALTRFAHAKPPTEASLRLSFPAAAAAALAASRPSADGKSLGRAHPDARKLAGDCEGRLESADRRARGDGAGAGAGTAGGRRPRRHAHGAGCARQPAAQAMAGWRVDARALLDARAALAQMARG